MMNNKLVKVMYLAVFSAFGLWMTSCNEEEVAGPAAEDVQVAESETTVETSYIEVEDLSISGILQAQGLGGRIEQDPRLTCATVTQTETSPGVFEVIIDFGVDGCAYPAGRVRKGIIKVVHDGNIWANGSVITVTLNNFSINGNLIEGTRTIKNQTTDQTGAMIVHGITMTGGKVTFTDGTTASREANITRTWKRDANNPFNDEFWFEGTASGVNRRGVSYSSKTINKIVFTVSCIASEVYIPVSGTKEVTTDRAVVTVDFGNGACDNTVIVAVNGRSKEVTINN